MKTIATVKKLTGALLAGVALMLFANAANALTASGTTISNTASVNYSVNSVPQSQINSTAATFKVDTELLLSVARADGAKVAVTPGQTTAAVLTYTVTNSGNSTEDVKLTNQHDSGVADPFGGAQADNFTPTATTVTMYVDTNTNGTYDAGTDTAVTSIASLAAGSSKTIFIVFTGGTVISATQANGDVSVYGLKGQLAVAGTCATSCTLETQDTSTDKNANLSTVLKVFADTVAGPDDSARDGISSARDAFIVSSAQLSISKTSTIVSDPVNGSTNPRAIPGATVKYTITVSNASGASVQQATGIAVTDSIPANMTFVSNSIIVTDPNDNSGNPITCTDAGVTTPAVTTEVTCSFSSNTVNAGGIHLTQSQSATVVFQATIN